MSSKFLLLSSGLFINLSYSSRFFNTFLKSSCTMSNLFSFTKLSLSGNNSSLSVLINNSSSRVTCFSTFILLILLSKSLKSATCAPVFTLKVVFNIPSSSINISKSLYNLLNNSVFCCSIWTCTSPSTFDSAGLLVVRPPPRKVLFRKFKGRLRLSLLDLLLLGPLLLDLLLNLVFLHRFCD